MDILRVDHLVLTVTDIERSAQWYVDVLGMRRIDFDGRVAVGFGEQKINLHEQGAEIEPHAQVPTVGSADLCLISSQSVDEVQMELMEHGIRPELGPVPRTGAMGPIASVYLRDPDGNLIEISSYL